MRSNKNTKKDQGFTLIELLAVIAIFGVLTAIVTTNYSRFSNDAILTNMAYELALSIREAQTYGVAVSNRLVNFDSNFGMSIALVGSPGQTQVYNLFEDVNTDYQYQHGSGCVTVPSGADDVCYKQYTLQRNIQITELLDSSCNSVNQLDIVFDRPNPEPKINSNKDFGIIILGSPEGTQRHVVVRQNGQIYVDSDVSDLCSP